ncbi:putative acyl transferase protein [Phaeoacremonium minimum UCRPA7]|uniref:Putative acyl transferase protein n=1 Tax=Phaeoacremonium minimum (strain UCR-PA7) TaxID=1286976 RepID=R8BNI5_PHAM7|nr:putative acyl transferase protein [Phaeoacremonium minimum UCRPA7]EOO00907.1 putative acyl transferase protein [Phaeoacremonium minimum UCRPA7]
MPKQEIFHLHPLGWEQDPEEERFKFSTLDYLPACVYNNYVLFFRLDDGNKSNMVALLKAGLERTLSQVRHLCGTVEKDAATGSHSFVKRRDGTIQFHVQWLDSPQEDLGNNQTYPSFDELESQNFSSTVLGDLGLWSVPPMTHGIKPEAHIDNSPAVSSFKANFIRGGLVFNIHVHHCSNDVMGWAAFTHQLAENCRAIHEAKTSFSAWDPACLDRSRLLRKDVPEEAKVDGPAPGRPHPDLMPIEQLLFHLPKSKAARLKALATPSDGTSWISTFDAFSAFIWRTLLRLRMENFKADPSTTVLWMAPVDMRKRLHDPPCPPRTQGNVFSLVRATATAGFVTEGPLSEVASFIRRLINGASQEELDKRLDMVATIRDKTNLFLRADTLAPLTLLVTDWRATNIAAADFGLASPTAFRHVSDNVTRCVVQVYPPRAALPESDEGCEFAIVYEKSLAKELIEDPEWSEYFEYRGIV